jgi:hypothetical protein
MTLVEGPLPPGADDRAADLVLARLHLRLGSYGLARAELESLAGRNALDDEGIRDLAEARWRTGDLPGAGEAAAAYLDLRPDDVLGLIISAELQSHLGRPADARKIAAQAMSLADDTIDDIFAGMPRSPVWPVEPGAPIEPAGTLFAELSPLPAVPGAPTVRPSEPAPERPASPASAAPGLWEHDPRTAAPVLPDPGELLTRAKAALVAERPGQAAASLALALRAEPSLAPAVLDLISGRSEPVLALVRGDAHRIVGHETEALLDYVAAVAAIGLERADDRRSGSNRMAAAGGDDERRSVEPVSEVPQPDDPAGRTDVDAGPEAQPTTLDDALSPDTQPPTEPEETS